MAKLVFDIETSALPTEQFDEAQQEYLFRDCEKIADESARAVRRSEILQQFNLWPFTAQVVCIAMLNAETSRGQVLFTAEDYEEDATDAGPVEFVPCVDEIEREAILQALRNHDFNRTETAKALGISRRALLYKLQRFRELGHAVDPV